MNPIVPILSDERISFITWISVLSGRTLQDLFKFFPSTLDDENENGFHRREHDLELRDAEMQQWFAILSKKIHPAFHRCGALMLEKIFGFPNLTGEVK